LIWNYGSCRFNNSPVKIFKTLKPIKSARNWTTFFSIYHSATNGHQSEFLSKHNIT
jgi:hypothetical protein